VSESRELLRNIKRKQKNFDSTFWIPASVLAIRKGHWKLADAKEVVEKASRAEQDQKSITQLRAYEMAA
jgi:hypothetical protein